MKMRSLLLAGVLAAACPAVARADTTRDEAKKEFTKGERAFARGDYLVAADAFDAANRLKSHPSAVWNAARARELGGDIISAANRYAEFLRIAPDDAPDRPDATAALARLSKRLGKLTLPPDTAASMDGATIAAGQSVYVQPGQHVVERDAATRHEIVIAAGEEQTVSFVREPSSEKVEPPSVATPAPPPPSTKPLSPIVAYAGAGVTLVLAGITVWSGLDTLSARSDYDGAPSAAQWSEGKDLRTRTNVLLGAAVAVAAATAVAGVFFVEWNRSTKVGLGPSTFTIWGTF